MDYQDDQYRNRYSGDTNSEYRRRNSSRRSSQPPRNNRNYENNFEQDDYSSYVPGRNNSPRERNIDNQSSQRVRKRIKKREKKQKRNAVFKSIVTAFIIICIIAVIVGTGVGIGMYTAVSTEISNMKLSDLARNHESFLMYTDASGNEKELEKIKSTLNRKWVSSEDISDNLKMAAIAIEDERFEKHNGVDIKRTIGATAKFVLSKLGVGESNYGGSTITQQVIKNITNEKEKSSTRKIKEMMRAIALEQLLTKDEIITMYLNIIYLANNCYGVEAASNMYFNKSADELTIAEAASIVGITQTPARFDPYAHPDNNINKRNTVLMKMLELEMISEDEYKKAVDTPLNVVKKKSNSSNEISSYFVDQVISDVISDLQAIKGYSAEFAQQQLTNGGLKIYTTVDLDIQETMENIFEKTSNFPSKSAEAAMVVMDPYTGEIKGLVGGLGKKTDIRGLNRATQAYRQPGSAIKPLSVYAPAIELEKIDENTIVKDEAIEVGSDNWKPSNAYSGFKGDMTVKEAVGRSSNIPAVKVLQMVGINKSYSFLQDNFKLSSIQSQDKNYSSLALGGLTKGVTVKDMAGAYSVFVNEGQYAKPITYTKVIDSSGETVLENSMNSSYAIKPTTAFIAANLLREPVEGSYGTARRAKLSSATTYGKTGTTNDNYDKWFVGFTPHYVGAVWYGYDQPKSVGSSNPAVTVWKKVMEQIHKGLPDKELSVPAGVVEAEICKKSGLLARRGCISETAYFTSGRQPKKICKNHYSSSSKSEASESPSPSASAEPSETPQATPSATTDSDEITTETEYDDIPGSQTNPPAKTQQPVQTQAPVQTQQPVQTQTPQINVVYPDDGGIPEAPTDE